MQTAVSKSQPNYRRPSWARREKSYDTYVHSDSAMARSVSKSPDWGPENFSYDPRFLQLWALPDSLDDARACIPRILKNEVHDWSLAGSAVCTALDRIARLREEAVKRGWPRSKDLAHLSRIDSTASPGGAATAAGSSIPPSSPTSPIMLPASLIADKHLVTRNQVCTPPSTAEDLTLPSYKGSIEPRPTPTALDSPPFSPIGALTPANTAEQANSVTLDLSKLTAELSPTSKGFPANSGPPTPGGCGFDENAWETYINSFRAELMDIRSHALLRWKGFARTIDRLKTEYAHSTEYKDAMPAFEQWWMSMRPQTAEYEERVKALQVPDLDHVKRERMLMGLPA